MAESDFQRGPLTYAVEALRIYFQPRSDVYVSGNLFIYYEEGNPRAAVTPDVFVVLGASNHDRRTYRLWQEPKAPDWVLEVTSAQTRRQDQGPKRDLYARLGVAEYWQYDPTGDYLSPPLQGFRLRAGRYESVSSSTSSGSALSLRSEVLGLSMRLEAGQLRFVDPQTGAVLLSHQEEHRARQAAEAHIAALEAQLQALREAAPPRDD